MASKPLSNADLVDTFLDFLEVSIHQILYSRNLYPPNLFERRRMWNMAVWQSRHKELNSYIKSTILACKQDIERGHVKNIHIRIFESEAMEKVVENHVFSVGDLTGKASTSGRDQHAEIQRTLETIYKKLSQPSSFLPKAPDEPFWLYLVELKSEVSSAGLAAQLDPMFVPAAPEQNSKAPLQVISGRKTAPESALQFEWYVEVRKDTM